MRAPSLYTYFDSKDDLFDAMFAEGYEQLYQEADRWLAEIEGEEPAAALTEVIGHWVRFCQASIARYQLMFTRAVPGWRPSDEAYAVSVRGFEEMVEQLEPLGIVSREDVDLYTAVASGLAAQQVANDPTGDRWLRLAPVAARMLIDDIHRRSP